ncbi:MAG: LytTR family DNA-binding domain-containing protein [Oscillospiraceae bacterium]
MPFLHIAICDDDPMELSRVSALLAEYRRSHEVSLTAETYQSATELLSVLPRRQYDLLLLDILMPGFSGIEAAHEVRSAGSTIPIIFLTSSLEFALESYQVKARDYLLKPVSGAKLFPALDALFAEEQAPFAGLYVKTQNGIVRIPFARLEVLEVKNRHLYFYSADGSVREVSATLQDYEDKLLARPEFIKVHRSYIVNLEQMSELTPTDFLTSRGDKIPISRLLYSGVRRAYMDHLFTEAGAK